jgi:hypothetical protein
MRTCAQRIAKYKARMLSTLVDPVLASISAMAVENFTTYAVDFVPNQTQMRGLLSAAGILPVKFGGYEAFHGELYHLTKVCTGHSLALAANILVSKWSDTQHLGAGATVLLAQIAADVYHIVIIGTP